MSASTKESKPNYKLTCQYCSKEFITKTYNSHMMSEHLQTIFAIKKNLDELTLRITKARERWFDPVELDIKKEEVYFLPCCSSFFSKKCSAEKHRKDPECLKNFKVKGNELLESLKSTGLTINTGDNTIINLTINDNSGALVEVVRRMTNAVDIASFNRASYYKKLLKIKKAVDALKERHKDDEELIAEIDELYPDSDISSVKSIYGKDDERYDNSDDDKYVEQFDASKEYGGAKFFKGCKVDLSRETLGCRTYKQSMADRKEKAEIEAEEKENAIYQERLRKEYEEEQKARKRAVERMELFGRRCREEKGLKGYIAKYGRDDLYKESGALD